MVHEYFTFHVPLYPHGATEKALVLVTLVLVSCSAAFLGVHLRLERTKAAVALHCGNCMNEAFSILAATKCRCRRLGKDDQDGKVKFKTKWI